MGREAGVDHQQQPPHRSVGDDAAAGDDDDGEADGGGNNTSSTATNVALGAQPGVQWSHPRRPDSEIVSYLTQIQGQLDSMRKEQQQQEEGVEAGASGDIALLVENVLAELRHWTASVMQHKECSVVMESLIALAEPHHVRRLMHRCLGYANSLAHNRFSSHVLQALFSRAGPLVQSEAESGPGFVLDRGGVDDEEQPPLLADSVLQLAQELEGSWTELMKEVSGSHSGRALIQLLGGRPVAAEPRGKRSKHGHSVGLLEGTGGGTWGETEPSRLLVPASFGPALEGVCAELLALPVRELQSLTCCPSACPLLAMLLRVLSEPCRGSSVGSQLPAGGMGMRLVERTLEWAQRERRVEAVYAMSGERVASHFLEAVIWLAPGPVVQELFESCFRRDLAEYCQDAISNFVVQAMLRRAHLLGRGAEDDLPRLLLECTLPLAPDLMRWGRGGVLWRAAESATSLSPGQQTAVLSAVKGVIAELDQQQQMTAGRRKGRDWLERLLHAELGGDADGGGGLGRPRPLHLSVPGARIAQSMLQYGPPAGTEVAEAVAALPADIVCAAARDNLAGRCLLDPILQPAGSHRSRHLKGAQAKIVNALEGQYVALARDKVGHHTLIKAFKASPPDVKRKIAKALVPSAEDLTRLQGIFGGRSVVKELQLELYFRGSRQEWEASVGRQLRTEDAMAEVMQPEVHAGVKEHAPTEGRERKRKRKGKDNAASGGALEESHPASVAVPAEPFASERGTHGEKIVAAKAKRAGDVLTTRLMKNSARDNKKNKKASSAADDNHHQQQQPELNQDNEAVAVVATGEEAPKTIKKKERKKIRESKPVLRLF
jgi:hypothetical protein